MGRDQFELVETIIATYPEAERGLMIDLMIEDYRRAGDNGLVRALKQCAARRRRASEKSAFAHGVAQLFSYFVSPAAH